MKANRSEGEVGRRRPIGLLPKFCESRVGLRAGLTEQDGSACRPGPSPVTTEEDDEASVRQETP